MTDIENQLIDEVKNRADKEGLSEKTQKILIWIVQETHGREGRINGPELRNQLERLGKDAKPQED